MIGTGNNLPAQEQSGPTLYDLTGNDSPPRGLSHVTSRVMDHSPNPLVDLWHTTKLTPSSELKPGCLRAKASKVQS